MKINSLFNNINDISIELYLNKCGINDVNSYLKGNFVENYNNYDNIEECASSIIKYINLDIPIHSICDSDFDGYFSASMLYVYLKMVNPNINIITHFHSQKEHGIDKDTLKELKKHTSSLLMVADAGTNDTEQCKKLKDSKWDIAIFDHHLREKENKYAIIVNNQISEKIENKGLCGTGVTFKVMQAIDNKLGVKYSSNFISYVWLANVSDSVSLIHPEQYTFAKWGRRRIHPNLQPFIDEWCKDELDNKTVAWQLTPKFNSTIRLGTLEDKQQLFKALCGEIDTSDIITKCKSYHTQQSSQSKKMMDEVDIVNNSSIVIGRLYKKTTMTGLIAGKLMSKYNKPILLVHESDGQMSGSTRSPIPIKSIYNDSGLFDLAQGHENSCGISYNKSNEQDIIEYLDTSIVDCEPCVDVISSTTIKNIPSKLFSLNKAYNDVFGMNIPIPIYHIQPFTIYNTDISILGKGNTIKFSYQGIDFIMFFVSNKLKEELYIGENKKKILIECLVELGLNEWNGRVKPQCIIQKLEVKEITFDEIF